MRTERHYWELEELFICMVNTLNNLYSPYNDDIMNTMDVHCWWLNDFIKKYW